MVTRKDSPLPLSALGLHLGELKPSTPHTLLQSVMFMSIGGMIQKFLVDLPPDQSLTSRQLFETPFIYLPRLYEHPKFKAEAIQMVEVIHGKPSLLRQDQLEAGLPSAQRANMSYILRSVFQEGMVRTMEIYINNNRHPAKASAIVGDVSDIAAELFAPLTQNSNQKLDTTEPAIEARLVNSAIMVNELFNQIKPPEEPLSLPSYAQLMRQAMPDVFWDATVVLKNYAISGRRFVRALGAICELDEFQCVYELRRLFSGKSDYLKSTKYEEAERNVITTYRDYLLSFRELNLTDLSQIHFKFMSTPGIGSIISEETRRRLQGAWGEVVAMKLFTSKLSQAFPQADVLIVPISEDLDTQGVDGLITVQSQNQAAQCIVVQIKAVWDLKPHHNTLFYAFTDDASFSYVDLVVGNIASAGQMVESKMIRRKQDRIRADLVNATTDGRKENLKIRTLLQSELGIDVATFTSLLLVVPSDPKNYIL